MPDVSPALMLSTLSDAVRQISDDARSATLKASLKELKSTVFAWRGGESCHFPGCEEDAIKASHTVQAASLRRRFGDTCVTPVWEKSAFAIRSRSIGSMSVFPGYCSAHESGFAFETRGHFADAHDDALQIMRAVHRELWLTLRKLEFVDHMQAAIAGTTAALRLEEKANLGEALALEKQSDGLAEFQMRLKRMEVRLSPLATSLENIVAGETPAMPMAVIAQDVPTQEFVFHSAVMLDDSSAALLAIALVYNGESSRLITAIEPDFEAHNLSYWYQFLSTGEDIDRTLDKWLRDGTLDWYANPAWWNGLSEHSRRELERAVNQSL